MEQRTFQDSQFFQNNMGGFGDNTAEDWSFVGKNQLYTRYHNNFYFNGDRRSSTTNSELPPINRLRLIKIVSICLALLLIGLLCVIIYLTHIRETKTRYYISQGKLVILQEYTAALGNKESTEYKLLSANFCNQMDKTFKKSRSYTNNYRRCVVTGVRPGSVIVLFTLYFDAAIDVSDTEVITTINASVQQVNSKHMLGDYVIDITGISVTTTLTLYQQDPLPFLEPNSDIFIPPTSKQTSTSISTISGTDATTTKIIPQADTTETKTTQVPSTETTKVGTTEMIMPTTDTTKPTTTMPLTTTAETTTDSHTETSKSTKIISSTTTTAPKTTTPPPTVTTKLTTTIPLTTTTETTTITKIKSTVATKSTTTLPTSTITEKTKITTLAPPITSEEATSTTLATTTTKSTTNIPLTITTEATTTINLFTTAATTSVKPTNTEEKATTTTSPSTTTGQTMMTQASTPEITTTYNGPPIITTEDAILTNTTKGATSEAIVTSTSAATVTKTTRGDTTEQTITSTTEATVTNTTRGDITEPIRTSTTEETIENLTRDVTMEPKIISTTEETITNTTIDDVTEATKTNTTEETVTNATRIGTTEQIIASTTEATFTNTARDVTSEANMTSITENTVTNTTQEVTSDPPVTNTTRYDTTETTMTGTSEDTVGTSSTGTTVSPYTADVMFPSKTMLAKGDTTLECVIKVTEKWEKVAINQDTENENAFLVEFYNNGSVFSSVTSEFLSVNFKQDAETIQSIIDINLQNTSSCPSLLRFTCAIIMEDIFESVITNTSTLSITAPLHNVTLDMATVYYSGERLELTCRTITDSEYGEVAFQVRSPSGSELKEPAPRSKYASTRNSDCAVDFEWLFKSSISLDSILNGSIVQCISSNRLLDTSVSASQQITILTSAVSFSQYYVPASVGQQVTIECKTNILTSNIDKMAVYKTSNGTNETIASYQHGNSSSGPDVTVTFQNGVLTLKFLSLKCSDEGLYICVVTSGSSEVYTPLSLTLQPTVLAGSTAVSLSLDTDIVENYYRYTSEHSCSGEIGYPDADGFLSLTATHPTSGKSVVYNEDVVTDAMKVKDAQVGSDIYNYDVTLAEDFRILVREDRKVHRNCSTIHKIRFFLNVSREWSRGSFRCEVRTKEGRIQTSIKEEQFYVIPGDVCDPYNKTNQVFIDHEKADNCNTYIQCGGDAPYGRQCDNPRHCVFIGKDYCDECVRAICTEIPTTTARPDPTTEASRGFSYLDCNTSSVYEGESANIGCHLNSSSFDSLNISRSNFTIASIQAGGSVSVSPNYQGKLFATLSPPFQILEVTISSVMCSDDGIYTVSLQLDSGNVTSTTFNVVMKVKPDPPKLSLHANLVNGENSLSHSCTGNVGNPPGYLQIQIRRSTDSNFTIYNTPGQIKSSSLVNARNCSFIQTANFSIDLTTDSWTNVTIRCVALNSVSLKETDQVPSSILYTRSSLSSEFCENKTATYYDYHPMGCPFYVWCVKGRPYGQVCPTNELCINPASGGCA